MNPEALQAVALAVAAETSVDRVLNQIVEGLVGHTTVALARVWLIAPGDICATCPLRAECPDQTRCLHLSASAGAPLDNRADWSRLDGAFRRFPLGVRKIGRIGASGDGLFIEDVVRDHDWIARPDWVRHERIGSFGGRVGFVLIAGILAAITTNISYWNWYGFPGVYTASYILIEIVGFFLLGVAAAVVLRRRDPEVWKTSVVST